MFFVTFSWIFLESYENQRSRNFAVSSSNVRWFFLSFSSDHLRKEVGKIGPQSIRKAFQSRKDVTLRTVWMGLSLRAPRGQCRCCSSALPVNSLSLDTFKQKAEIPTLWSESVMDITLHTHSQRVGKPAVVCQTWQNDRNTCSIKQSNGAHCRLRPRHPLHDGLVSSRSLQSSRTRSNQHDVAGALACAQWCHDVARCNGIDGAHYVQIWRYP